MPESESWLNVPLLNPDTGHIFAITRSGSQYFTYNPETMRTEQVNGRNSVFRPGNYMLLDGRTLVTLNSVAEGPSRVLAQWELEGPGGTSTSSSAADNSAALQRLREQIGAERSENALNRAFESSENDEQRRFEQNEARAGRQFESRENALTRTFQQRQALYSEIGNLVGQVAAAQQRARELRAEIIGKDPIRGAIMGMGGVQRGATPNQQFTHELSRFADQPVSADMNADMYGLQWQANALRQRATDGMPVAPMLGMADGGTFEGSTITTGSGEVHRLRAGEGVLVGEGQRGEGIAAGTAEVIRFDDDGRVSEIIPLRAQAADGAMISPAQRTSIEQALSPIWGGLGMSRIPRFKRQGGIYNQELNSGAGAGMSADTLSRLGVRPRLIDITNPQYGGMAGKYFVGADGNLRPIRSDAELAYFGYRPQDVVRMNSQDVQSMGYGGVGQPLAETGGPPEIEPSRPYGPMSTPLTVPGMDVMLPDPMKIASLWRNLDPDTQASIMGAYDLAGLNALSMIDRLNIVTPRSGNYATARLG